MQTRDVVEGLNNYLEFYTNPSRVEMRLCKHFLPIFFLNLVVSTTCETEPYKKGDIKMVQAETW